MITPVKSILDPAFRYTNAANTDLRKTFARIRSDQPEQTLKAPKNERIERQAGPRHVP
jgi:hypothetical protein